MSDKVHCYKIVVIGDAKTYKTSFLEKHLTGSYAEKYSPTHGVEVKPFCFNTNYGCITLNIWDCAGQEHLSGLKEEYYREASACLVFYNTPESKSNVKKWKTLFADRVSNGIVLEVDSRLSMSDDGYTVFLELLRQLTGKSNLTFVGFPPAERN